MLAMIITQYIFLCGFFLNNNFNGTKTDNYVAKIKYSNDYLIIVLHPSQPKIDSY